MTMHFLRPAQCIWVCLLILNGAGHAESRVALVIGNAAYQSERKLDNPVNDARLLEKTLKNDLGFDEVITLTNANRVAMNNALARLAKSARGAQAAFVYYSGHGIMNSKRQNYLLPTDVPRLGADASADTDTELENYAITANKLIDAVSGANVQVVVLDACRDNMGNRSRSGSKGLARIKPVDDKRLLIAYATSEGNIAEDGVGQNSTYATSLARNLLRKDQPLLSIFDAVADEVEKQTRGKQSPTREGNMRASTILLASLAPVAVSDAPKPPAEKPPPVAEVKPEPAATPIVATAQSNMALIDGRYQPLGDGSEIKDLKTGL